MNSMMKHSLVGGVWSATETFGAAFLPAGALHCVTTYVSTISLLIIVSSASKMGSTRSLCCC